MGNVLCPLTRKMKLRHCVDGAISELRVHFNSTRNKSKLEMHLTLYIIMCVNYYALIRNRSI